MNKEHIGWTICYPAIWNRPNESYPDLNFDQAWVKMMEGSEGTKFLDHQIIDLSDGSVQYEATVDLTQKDGVPVSFTFVFLLVPLS